MSRFGTPAQSSYGRINSNTSAGLLPRSAAQSQYLVNNAAQQTKSAKEAGLDRLFRILRQEDSLQGSLFLEAGPSNRLILSLKSNLAAEIDFALERLLLAVSIEAEILLLRDFPSLLEALVGVIHRASNHLIHPLSWQSQLRHSTRHEVLRQATEAALILRIIAQHPANVGSLQHSRLLRNVMVDVLEAFNASVFAEDTSELVVTLLDILDVISPYIEIRASTKLSSTQAPMADAATDSPQSATASHAARKQSHLFPALLPLCHSQDRALLLGAYRCLANLASSPQVIEQNETVFTFSCSQGDSPQRDIIDRAIQLLDLPDPDLIAVILDFLYSYTLIISNADSMCGRQDIHRILRILISKLSIGSQREDFEAEPLAKLNERSRAEILLKRELEKFQVLPTKLPPAEFQLLAGLPEPQRTHAWLKWVFEELVEGEITQVNLWSAYREQFEPMLVHQATGGVGAPVMAAAEVIKCSNEAHSLASPMVIEQPERRFIIKGMKLRDRNELADSFRRMWCGMPNPDNPYSQVPASIPSPSTADNSDILLAALQMFLQVQHPLPTGALARKFVQFRAYKQSSTFNIHFSRWSVTPSLGQSQNAANGPALLAATTLRNLARAVKATCRPVERSHDFSGPNLLDILSGQAAVADSTGATRETSGEAAQATQKLLDLEDDILNVAMSSRSLSSQLGEVLQAIAEIREDRQRHESNKDQGRALFT